MAAGKKKQPDLAGGQGEARVKNALHPTETLASPIAEAPLLPYGLPVSKHLVVAAAIAIVTWFCLHTCLANSISDWDDTPYLRDDLFIKDLTWHGIRNIFTNTVMGNYHPLTILSFAVEYSLVQLEPWLYHFDNLLLHTCTTLLVYWFALALSRRPVAAAVTALLFGLHPMHIESVAWASGRKDVLCGLFYMAACVAYVFYLRAAKGRRSLLLYIGILLFYLLALLSKAIAVTLPLSFLLIDYFEGRRLSIKVFIEKIPHFLLALLFGILSVKAQHAAGAMDMQKVVFNPLERLALGCYALFTYLWKAVMPIGLHCLYPYPHKEAGALPLYWYLYPAAIAALAFLLWKYARRNKVIVFGALFFIFNIALLLQFLPVGESIVAERYSYLPYTGLFFIVGWYVSVFVEQGLFLRYRQLAVGLTTAYIMCLGYQSYQRCAVWANEVSLWTDEVEKEPLLAPQAWSNLGYIYSLRVATATSHDEGKIYYDSAVYLLNRAIGINPKFINPYVAMGDMQRNLGLNAEAKATFYRAYKINPNESNLALELAITYYMNKNMDSAGFFFRRELALDSSSPAHGNFGNYLESVDKNDSALMEYNKAVALSSTNYIIFANRGKLFKKLKRWPEAAKDFDMAISMNPDVGELYYLRSFCDTQQHNMAMALKHVEKALSLGYTGVNNEYYGSLKK
jgi:tetratricopeptide (TPR) repeat protein